MAGSEETRRIARLRQATSIDELHAVLTAALQARDYESLVIKRSGDKCYLVVAHRGSAHVYVDHHGKQVIRRHAWQIREWLNRAFGIDPRDVPVERLAR